MMSNYIDPQNSIQCQFTIWDSAGQERYGDIVRSYYSKADGVILVFDLTEQKSFKDLRDWISKVRNATGRGEQSIPMIMVGNKLDLINNGQKGRAVEYDTAKEFAKVNDMKYHETSAKEGSGI